MKIAVLVIWSIMAIAFYVGLRARLMRHQPCWQAGAVVLLACTLFAVGVLASSYFAGLPVYGEEDGTSWGQG